jgi:hypothetical protein
MTGWPFGTGVAVPVKVSPSPETANVAVLARLTAA